MVTSHMYKVLPYCVACHVILTIASFKESLECSCMIAFLDCMLAKGGGTTGARGALAPLKFAVGGLSPPYAMAL